ncbi:MAG TPA: DUF6714 family protein [Fimbriimonas sp.]|nr:DUF6714 family protein [Fimbriimonas sp.]
MIDNDPWNTELTPELQIERESLLANIEEAFSEVNRLGGVSWGESVVYDNYGSPEQAQRARAQDNERSWRDLVDDPNWTCCPGVGGFNFLDPIGFRYYLPVAMMRVLQDGDDEVLGSLSRGWEKHRDVFDETQLACIERFTTFLQSVEAHRLVEEGW